MTNSFDGLPDILQRVAEKAGLEAALKLSAEFGGTSIYIPKNPDRESRLAQSIGRAAARAIAAEWGGEEITVPVCRALKADELHRRILALRDEGWSKPRIAREVGVTERWVEMIISRAAGRDDSQLTFPSF